MQYEDFFEPLKDLLVAISSLTLTRKEDLLSKLADPEISNYVVVILRLLCSSWMRSRPGDFDGFLIHPETGDMLSLLDFVQGQVEASVGAPLSSSTRDHPSAES